jgi:hypothetical protein
MFGILLYADQSTTLKNLIFENAGILTLLQLNDAAAGLRFDRGDRDAQGSCMG